MGKLEKRVPEKPKLLAKERFLLILAVILLIYGMSFMILGATLKYDMASYRFYMARQAVGSMLYTLFLGAVTGGLVWVVKWMISRNRFTDWRKPVLWGTGFWAVMTFLYRLNILMGIG
jgi:hypothetical protein